MPEKMDLQWLSEFIAIVLKHAYLGAFIISLAGSLIPFLPLPYLIPIVLLADRFNPILLGIFSGLGAAIGKITSYLLGLAGRKILKKKDGSLTLIARYVNKYGTIAVFLFALTPLPDDVIYVPLGFAKMNFIKFMFANALGKILLSILVAVLGKTYFYILRDYLSAEINIYTIISSVILMIGISVLLFKVDWEKLFSIYKTSGMKGVLKTMLPHPKRNPKE
ncbi:MAG: VTT domain-containing protein [Nitrososphaerota archaeon]